MSDPLRLDDGHQTIFTFQNSPTLKFYEKEVTPPGMELGAPIDTTTMRNKRLRTFIARKLKTLTPVTANCSYRSDVFDQADGVWPILGVNQQITIEFSDNSHLQFWGFLNDFKPGPNTEGNQPMASITIQPSNQNNDSPPLEVDPLYTDPVAPTNVDPYYEYDALGDSVFP